MNDDIIMKPYNDKIKLLPDKVLSNKEKVKVNEIWGEWYKYINEQCMTKDFESVFDKHYNTSFSSNYSPPKQKKYNDSLTSYKTNTLGHILSQKKIKMPEPLSINERRKEILKNNVAQYISNILSRIQADATEYCKCNGSIKEVISSELIPNENILFLEEIQDIFSTKEEDIRQRIDDALQLASIFVLYIDKLVKNDKIQINLSAGISYFSFEHSFNNIKKLIVSLKQTKINLSK